MPMSHALNRSVHSNPATRLIAVALLAGLMLSGCTAGEDTATPSASPQGATVGGDGSEIKLDGLTEPDLKSAALTGELACSFQAQDNSTILYAMGIVGSKEPAQGVVKVAGEVERLGAPGGFNGMIKGALFTGRGKTVVVAITGAAMGGESPALPATLTYQRADGASRSIDGIWQCGP